MNNLQQKSQIAKKIFEKVDEFKDWSVKVDRIKEEFNILRDRLVSETERYDRLNSDFDRYKTELDNKIAAIKDNIKKLSKEEDDKVQSIKELEVKILNKQKESNEFRNKVEISKKDLTDKIKGIEAELVEMDRKKEEKTKEVQAIQLEARLATVSYQQLKEETEKLAKKLLEMKDHIADLERRENDMAIRELRLQRLKKEVINK